MNRILQAKDAFKSFYEKYDRYLNGLVRFLFALFLYLTVFYHTGYNTRLTKPVIALVLAFISAFLPVSGITIIMCLLILAEFASVSLEVTGVTLMLMTMMMLMYFVFRSGKNWLMAISCLMCLLRVPHAMLPAALLINPIETIPLVFGVVLYGLIVIVKKDVLLLSSSSSLGMAGRINQLLSGFLSSEKFLLTLLSVAAAAFLISAIKKQRISYAHLTAMIAGDFLYLLIMIIGDLLMNVEISLLPLLTGFAVNVLLSAVIIILVINMDYRHTEQVEFEDDEYYYYVKAVPKMTVSAAKKTVETIRDEDEELEKTFTDTGVFVRPDDTP